ncbi:RNA-binding transcriptional accessory protein [Thauera sp. CAU 1555]|uniref:RNA-binding transcriptional accessory protein n=1 Tax=Thauera sedimentorum TaxID=2767595 RepID=A0ABR9B8Q3_9RHOO|nr:Tex family protein [Thauera sedimentorum]MBC9071819.1 RNA-binding transcriptional accessory protein [Thauera sedimentorum]MBD8502738.1 RNA-binding transcriptional accessory protein [Thauera sedimentorum]
MLPPIEHRIATELGVQPRQVFAAVALLDEGATVPFVARYRKEATGGLDDTQLRNLEERLGYLRELEDRRATVIASIEEQGKLTDALRAEVENADTKQRLEDLYLPYKPKRRTKAQIAREAGIGPLAEALLADPTLNPEAEAAAYLNEETGFADTKSVLDGARQILIEQFAEDAELLGTLRGLLADEGEVVSTVVEGKENEGAKFRDWFDFREPIAKIPSHRALALLRGRNEGVLRLALALPHDPEAGPHPCERRIAARFQIRDQGRAADRWLADTVRWTWNVKISLHLELELMNLLRERAEEEAIHVFARNLKDLLLAAPAGARPTMGLDPGIRTGVKVAVVDTTGKLLDTATVYPFEPRRDVEGALATLAALAKRHGVELVAIGNGTASRETDALTAELIRRHPELRLTKVMVSEAGASVYSASELAAREFPDVDVSLRGAVSIARRLQDPLAELVKIDPKSIGVGQYQHDVNQSRLARSLDAVVEDCVNAVGVDVNTASAPLLARISGLNGTLAANIVEHRNANGPFRSRDALKAVARLGPKTFEQAAGFLRIPAGDNPLDASAVHPEAYPVVERILARVQKGVRELMGNGGFLKSLKPAEFTDERFGLPTVQDILAELEKPGRDPRPEFRTATFREGVETLKDLVPGMMLEGVVTNVTNFGAFVDIGVHQDGLVHVSALADRFVKDPHSVVKAGQVVKVKVLEVDLPRQRIALTMRMGDEAAPKARTERNDRGNDRRPDRAQGSRQHGREREPAANNALAAAFARAKQK